MKIPKKLWWQALFTIFGLSWLVAPSLNDQLAARTTLISEYETPLQVYSGLYRASDILAATLLLVAIVYLRQRITRYGRWLLPVMILIGGLTLIDPIITTDCIVRNAQCVEPSSFSALVHNTESTILALLLFGVALYDAVKKRRLMSSIYVVTALAYLLLDASTLSTTYRLETLSQYIYQIVTIIWLGWFVARFGSSDSLSNRTMRISRRSFAIWAYFNGGFAILISLAHLRIFGPFENLYFANGTAWLAQHGVLVGLTMLYISRHLWRGEKAARMIFLILLFLETVKYALIAPHTGLAILYGLSFVVLLVFRTAFRRGETKLTRHYRLYDALAVFVGAVVIASLAIIVISREPRHFEALRQAGGHFSHYVGGERRRPHHHAASPLLAHTMTVFLSGTVLLVLWSLFRPERHTSSSGGQSEAKNLLALYGTSSEDHFKVWPEDKEYYWASDRQSFIAYKIAGSVVFALADPVGPSQTAIQALLSEFIASWQAKGYRICFMIAPETSLVLYSSAGLSTTQVGSNAVINIESFTTMTVRSKWWRWQMNRAKKAGYIYATSLPPHSNAFIAQLRQVSDAWLTRPGHEERGFALGDFNATYMQDSIIHYLSDESGRLIAFANQLPCYNQNRQTTIDLMRFLPDANNAMPFLLASITNRLHEEGQFDYFDLGFVPLASMRGRLATVIKQLAASQFSAAGLEQFKNKFEPEWQACYVAYDGDLGDLATIALNLEKVMKPSTSGDTAQ